MIEKGAPIGKERAQRLMMVCCFSYVADALVLFCSSILKLSEGMQIFSASGWRSWIPYASDRSLPAGTHALRRLDIRPIHALYENGDIRVGGGLAMTIKSRLAVILAEREMKLTELEGKTGISLNNLSILKTGKAKAVRFSTLNEVCKALDCQPGDLLQYVPDEGNERK